MNDTTLMKDRLIMRIAIVEDDINMRKSLEIALGEYEEFTISSYKSAIDALKKIDNSVDLIVTDINMPGMDWIEFIKKLDGAYDIIVGQELYGYIRQVRIQQNWKLNMQTIGN